MTVLIAGYSLCFDCAGVWWLARSLQNCLPLLSNGHHRSMIIVWRVRGKIVRFVLCSIVCNNCAQYSAHTWTDLTVVCWLDLALLWLYCVLQFICVRFSSLGIILCYSLSAVYVCFCCVRFSFCNTMPRDWLGRMSLKWLILCRVEGKTLTQSMNKTAV